MSNNKMIDDIVNSNINACEIYRGCIVGTGLHILQRKNNIIIKSLKSYLFMLVCITLMICFGLFFTIIQRIFIDWNLILNLFVSLFIFLSVIFTITTIEAFLFNCNKEIIYDIWNENIYIDKWCYQIKQINEHSLFLGHGVFPCYFFSILTIITTENFKFNIYNVGVPLHCSRHIQKYKYHDTIVLAIINLLLSVAGGYYFLNLYCTYKGF